MTRISSIEQFQQGIDNILRQQARLNQTQLELSTGKKVNKPSDDPSAATQLLKLSALKSNTKQYDRNIDAARNQLELQESVLSNVGNVLQRIRELVIQANNATQSNESRAAIADELYNRIDELLQYANTKDPDGEYIFSGFNSRAPAFVKNGANFLYQGDQGERLLQISEDSTIAVRTNGASLFEAIKTGDGRFILQTGQANSGNALVKLDAASSATLDDYTLTMSQATASDPLTYTVKNSSNVVIATGDYTSGESINFEGITMVLEGNARDGDTYQVSQSENKSIFSTVKEIADSLNTKIDTNSGQAKLSNDLGQAIGSLEQASLSIQVARTSVGNKLEAIDVRSEENSASLLRLEKQVSELQDLDFAQAVSQLTIQSTALQAAQQSYIKIQGLSLFNFLR